MPPKRVLGKRKFAALPWASSKKMKRTTMSKAAMFKLAKAAARSISEKKYADVTFSGQAVASDNLASADLTDIDNGNTVATRIGNRINVDKIWWNLAFECDSGFSTAGTVFYRYVIVQSKRQNLTPSAILPSPTAAIDPDEVNVLYDSGALGFQVTPTTLQATGRLPLGTMNSCKPIKREIIYNDGTGSNNKANGIYFIAVADNTDASGLHPLLTGSLRLYFRDP